MNKRKNLWLLCLFLLGFLVAPGRPAAALVNGCCQWRPEPNGPFSFQNLTDSECSKLPINTFLPNYVTTADGKGCEAAPAPTTSSDGSTPKVSNPLDNPKLSVRIPGLTLRNSTCDANGCSAPWLADYIDALYRYGLSAITILAVVAMMIGGILWLTAAGNEERVGDARKWIGGSLMGTLIAFTAYLTLNLVNPALTELSPIKIKYIEQNIQKEEVPDDAPGTSAPGTSNIDTAKCPPGITTVDRFANYYAKEKTIYYSQAMRGECSGGKCYCDCSYFGDLLSSCTKLRTVQGEGTSAGLWANSSKKLITADDCDNPTKRLKPGDPIVKIKGQGHVLTYIGNNQLIECGGGSKQGLITQNGAIKLSDWKTKCHNYLLKNEAYFISR